MSAIPGYPDPSVKPGYQTTEFWGKTLVQGVGILALMGFLTPDDASNAVEIGNQIIAFAALVLPEVGYAVARGLAKWGK